MVTTVEDGSNTYSDAVPLSAPVTFEQTVGGSADPVDYFVLTPESDSTLEVSLRGLSADADLHLFNAAGRRVAQSRTDGTADESFTYDVTGGQQYVLGITAESSASTPYTAAITVDGQADDGNSGDDTDEDTGGDGGDTGASGDGETGNGGDDPPQTESRPAVGDGGDSIASPALIQIPVNFSQSVGGADDRDDYYQIQATESGTLVARLTGLTADVDLHLYDPAGIRIAQSRNGGTADEEFTFDVEAGSSYVLGITPNTSANSPYQVTMTLNGEEGYNAEFDDNDGFGSDGDSGGGGGSGFEVPGDVISAPSSFSQSVGGPADTDDYYNVTANETGVLTVTLTGMTADLGLFFYDADGRELASSHETGTTDEQLTVDVVAGNSYFLGVSPNTLDTSPYQITMTLNGNAGPTLDVTDEDGYFDDGFGEVPDDGATDPPDLGDTGGLGPDGTPTGGMTSGTGSTGASGTQLAAYSIASPGEDANPAVVDETSLLS